MLLTRETLLHSARDEHGLIQVTESPHARCLYFNSNVEQSRIFLNAPQALAFEYQEKIVSLALDFLFELKPPASPQSNKPSHSTLSPKLLMLGLGGGCMTTQIHQVLPKLEQTLVELRQIVIDAAFDYFYCPQADNIKVVCEDALLFAAQNQTLFDVLLVDLYDHQSMPPDFYEESFQQNLLNGAKLPGLVIFNLWADDPKSTQRLIPYWQSIAAQNPKLSIKTYLIQSSQNIILTIQQS